MESLSNIFIFQPNIMTNWLPILRRRGCSVLFYSFINHGYKNAYYEEVIGVPIGVNQHLYVDGWVVLDLEDAANFNKVFDAKLNSESYIDFFRHQCRSASDALFRFGDSIRNHSFESSDNSELLRVFSEFTSLSIRTIPFLTTIVQMQGAIEEKILTALQSDQNLGKEWKSNIPLLIQNLLLCGSETPLATKAIREIKGLAKLIYEEHNDLARMILSSEEDTNRIAKLIPSEFPKVASSIDAYLYNYDFLATDYYLGKPLSIIDAINQIKSLLKKGIDTQDVENEIAFDGVMSSSNSKLIERAQDLNFLRQYRIEALFKSGRDARSLFQAIGYKLGLAYEEVMALQFSEIYDSLIDGALTVSFDTLSSRLRDYGVLIENGITKIAIGIEIESLRNQIKLPDPYLDNLIGVAAVVGEVEGFARVITVLDDITLMRAGEILVAPMTSPYHVQAMTIASAIVTDEGGILSHAAILSRELGLPCIVGTKFATERISTGDRIRVFSKPTGAYIEIIEKYN